MNRIAIYGKGGIGKSTVAAALSYCLARQGKRVLHVGCDPKHDSCLALVPGGVPVTVIDRLCSHPGREPAPEDIIANGKLGIDCIEAGGPQPGVGCGGRAVSRMFELLETMKLLEGERYQVAVFDILGDVVCGGFAAPLRRSVAPRVVIVVSEEMASLYAANNIVAGVNRFVDNGATLAGLVVNLRGDGGQLRAVERVAGAMGTRILTVLPRDERVLVAERRGKTVVELAPDSEVSEKIEKLSEILVSDESGGESRLPVPLELEALRDLLNGAEGEASR